MKRIFLSSAIMALCTPPASAILDTNNNGMSDVWERLYNNGELFPSTFDPLDDDDSDGWTNAEEAVAGTDPESSLSPNGMVRPEVTILHDVALDLDNDGFPELYAEVATITWPIIAGKFYTLLYSPDMTENSWIFLQQAAAISDGTRTANFPITSPGDKMFWRVTVEDIDSDGDGLTDAEEYMLGTDPHNAQTIAGIPDFWLARYFTNILLAGGLNTIDPNADPDDDGYTNEQEAYLGTNPNTPNTPITGKIGQEAIVNGTFSEPGIGSLPSNTSDTTWDYWGAGGVKGWSAYVGTNIEFQNITPQTSGNPYVELKAHPEGHYGIKQEVGTQKGPTYLLALDCRNRADVPAACSNFNILVGNKIIRQISFSDPTATTPPSFYVAPGAWTTVTASFKAVPPVVIISLVPVNTLDDTTGCLVDNVRIAPVAIADNAFASGVDDVSITGLRSTAGPAKGCQDDYWIMAPAGNEVGGDAAANLMKFKIPLEPAVSLGITSPLAEATPATVTLDPTDPLDSWHGTGTETGYTTDNAPVFTIGGGQVSLPIKVKTMQRRLVKVALHKVFGLDGNGNQTTPQFMPSAGDLVTALNMVYGKQVNAFFDVMPFDEKDSNGNGIRFDDGDGILIVDQSNDERNAATPNSKSVGDTPTAHIDVWVVGGVILKYNAPSGLGGAFGMNYEGTNILVDGSLTSDGVKNKTAAQKNELLKVVIAHEIGHIMLAAGGEAHCDDESSFSFLGLNHPSIQNRLMTSGSPDVTLSRRLLIKTEWDYIENWLHKHVDP